MCELLIFITYRSGTFQILGGDLTSGKIRNSKILKVFKVLNLKVWKVHSLHMYHIQA